MLNIKTFQELADALYGPDEDLKKEILHAVRSHVGLTRALQKSVSVCSELASIALQNSAAADTDRAQRLLAQLQKEAEPKTDNTATPTSIYLWDGVRENRVKLHKLRRHMNGEIGAAEWVASFASIVDEYVENDPRDYPGVFHYEVAPALGNWLVDHPEATAEEFRAELDRATNHWIESNTPQETPQAPRPA